MTTPTSTSTEQTANGAEDFTTGEGLRALLNRLFESGEDAWVHDPVVRDLMEFAADKYAALARKHKLDTLSLIHILGASVGVRGSVPVALVREHLADLGLSLIHI